MSYAQLALVLVIAFAASAIAIRTMQPFAWRVGLIDKPNARKHHVGRVPLIGGLCFFAGTLVGTVFLDVSDKFVDALLLTALPIALIGAIDDAKDLSVRARLLVQSFATLGMIASTGVYIENLGNIFGTGDLHLGLYGIPLTLVAVIGLINAFNMLDGIDGLAGSLTLVSIASIMLFARHATGGADIMLLLPVLSAALIPYLCANLGLWPNRKIFMGDAGSMLIGYLLAWSLIYLSQHVHSGMSSIDVLWCVAVPVLDTLAIMYRRMRKGQSPFKPDREHLHHILLRAGLGPRRTLLAICALGCALTAVGLLIQHVPYGFSAIVFALLLIGYIAALNYGSRVYKSVDNQPVHPAAKATVVSLPDRSKQFANARHGDHSPPSRIFASRLTHSRRSTD